MGNHLQTEAVVPILLFSIFLSKSFFQPLPFFYSSAKTYNFTHTLAVNVASQSSASGDRRDLSFRLVIFWLRPFSFIETSDRVKLDSLIAKGFIFEVAIELVTEARAIVLLRNQPINQPESNSVHPSKDMDR